MEGTRQGNVGEQEGFPWVSVILPTYNRADKIGASIESVQNQTYPYFELLVIDDGSEDDTCSVVEAYKDERLRYIRLERNAGQSAARNIGMRQAKYGYLAFQDSDDRWLPQKLELQMKRMLAGDKDLGMVYHKFSYQIEGVGYIVKPGESLTLSQKEGDIYRQLLWDNLIGMPTLLMKKECFDTVGGFDESLRSLEDYDFVLRIAAKYRAAFIDEILLEAEASDEGVSGNLGNYIAACCMMLQKYKKDCLKAGVFNHRVEMILQRAALVGMEKEVALFLERLLGM